MAQTARGSRAPQASQTWKCSGLRWAADGPELKWDGGRGSPLPRGKRVAFAVAEGGGRTCVGARGNPCPVRTAVPERSTGARCEECARLDRAHSVAADTIADDPRPYHVYLAWFGPGLLKVGLTAAGRGRDRLLEQAAITFTMLAADRYAPVRQAERLISATGLAAERISARAKTSAWQSLPPPAERAALLSAARAQLISGAPWPGQARLLPGQITDQAADFGLSGQPPGTWREVTGISDGAVLSGQVRLTAGRHLLLDSATGPLLCDMRRAAGWTIRPCPGSAPAPAGLTLASRSPTGGHDDSQQPLF